MDNIVSSFEEIELTESEIEFIYGAQGGGLDVWDSHTQAAFSGSIVVNSWDLMGTTLSSTITDTSAFTGTVFKTLS